MHDVDGVNAGYARLLLDEYLDNPESVSPEWRALFESADTEVRITVEIARFPMGSRTAEEVASKIAPPPRAVIEGTARRIMRTALSSNSSNAPCQAASSNFRTGPGGGPPELV